MDDNEASNHKVRTHIVSEINEYTNVGIARMSATCKSIAISLEGRTYYISISGLQKVMNGDRLYTTVAVRSKP